MKRFLEGRLTSAAGEDGLKRGQASPHGNTRRSRHGIVKEGGSALRLQRSRWGRDYEGKPKKRRGRVTKNESGKEKRCRTSRPRCQNNNARAAKRTCEPGRSRAGALRLARPGGDTRRWKELGAADYDDDDDIAKEILRQRLEARPPLLLARGGQLSAWLPSTSPELSPHTSAPFSHKEALTWVMEK